MRPLEQWFFGMSRTEIEAAVSGWSIPHDVMVMVYTAVSPQKHEVGIGSGPTLEQVINHYMNEKAYGKLRLLPDALLQHLLDKAMQYTDVGAWNDTKCFKLPSLRYHMDTYNVGQFAFMTGEYYHKTIASQVKLVKAKLLECLPFVKEFENV